MIGTNLETIVGTVSGVCGAARVHGRGRHLEEDLVLSGTSIDERRSAAVFVDVRGSVAHKVPSVRRCQALPAVKAALHDDAVDGAEAASVRLRARNELLDQHGSGVAALADDDVATDARRLGRTQQSLYEVIRLIPLIILQVMQVANLEE